MADGTGAAMAATPQASPQASQPAAQPTNTMATPPGAQPAGAQPNGGDGSAQSLHQKGRSKIPWGKDVWDRIDQAVAMEVKRTRIGARFLPIRQVPPKTTSVPTDAYTVTNPNDGTGSIFSVDEGATIRLNEYYVEFELTPQQVDQEEGDFKQLGHSTAVTLATKAANVLALAEDLIIFQGQNAITGALPFTTQLVQTLGGNKPLDTGLLNFPIGANAPGAGPLTPAPAPLITVDPVAELAPAVPGVIYGPNTFEAVALAYSQLQAVGQYGPYALVLETIPYADTFAPLPATLTLTADRIKPLVTAGYFGAGTLPPNPAAPAVPPAPPYYGVMVSLGGNTMDLVVGIDAIAAFLQEDTTGNFRFRVLQRFALRVKDPTAIVILQFN
ncbi:MAG: encapsulin [Steroidobacteraceae bacterium]